VDVAKAGASPCFHAARKADRPHAAPRRRSVSGSLAAGIARPTLVRMPMDSASLKVPLRFAPSSHRQILPISFRAKSVRFRASSGR
jgi:hypothetical protein